MNTLPAIVSAILAAVAVDLGADQVREGTYVWPSGSLTFAGLTPPALTASVSHGRGPDWYLETYTAELRMWAPVTSGETDERAERSRIISAEVVAALDLVRAQVGTALWRCVSWRVVTSRPDPAAAQASPGWAHAAVSVEFQFRRQTGTGV